MTEREILLARMKELKDHFPNWKMKIEVKYDRLKFINGALSFHIQVAYSGKISVHGYYPPDMLQRQINIYNEKNKLIHGPSLDIYASNFSIQEIAEKIQKKFLIEYMEHFILIVEEKKKLDIAIKAQSDLNLFAAKLLGHKLKVEESYEHKEIFFDANGARGRFRTSTFDGERFELNISIYDRGVFEKVAKAIK